MASASKFESGSGGRRRSRHRAGGAAGAARRNFAEIVTLTHPEALMPLLDTRRARRHPARPQFRARRDRRRRRLSLAAADPRQGSRRGDRDHHRAWRTDHRGRRDQARRGRFRHQALVERAAGGDGAQRGLAARIEARHPHRAQPRGRTRHAGRRHAACSARPPRCGASTSLIERAAPTDANVLILGENGTGKELVARELHRRSRRGDEAMVSVDLGAVSESLFESELFGHVKGAFTDAKADRIGRLQAGNGGTVFLDEIGNLPLHLQPKLLTALERREVTPVGANRAGPDRHPADHRDQHVARPAGGRGRVPPGPAVPAQHGRNRTAAAAPAARRHSACCSTIIIALLRAQIWHAAADARPRSSSTALCAYDWPGNVRALRHATERAVILAEGDHYRIEDFPLPRRPRRRNVSLPNACAGRATTSTSSAPSGRWSSARCASMHYNISLAAAELGLTRTSLYRRMEKHGL